MSVIYRSFINKCGQPVKTIPTGLARELSKGRKVPSNYKNCEVCITESCIIERSKKKPMLHSVHIWSLKFDKRGQITKRSLKRLSGSLLSNNANREKHNPNDILTTYIYETFNIKNEVREDITENNLYSELWAIAAA